MASRLQKKVPILSQKDLQQVAQSDSPFIQVETSDQQVFLDTSLQQILYGEPIGADSPSSNLSTVWIMTEASQGTPSYIISNVTTPIGQVQPSSDQTGEGTYDMNVLSVSLCYTSTGFNFMYGPLRLKEYFYEDALCASIIRDLRLYGLCTSDNEFIKPVSTNQDFVWTADIDVSNGKWALYIEQPGAPRLYALPVPVKSGLTPPRDNLIQAVDVNTQDVNVYVFTRFCVDSIKYKSDMPPGIDVFLRPQPQRTM